MSGSAISDGLVSLPVTLGHVKAALLLPRGHTFIPNANLLPPHQSLGSEAESNIRQPSEAKASTIQVAKNNASAFEVFYPKESTVGITSRTASVLNNV